MRYLILLATLALPWIAHAEGQLNAAAVSTSGTTARSAQLGPGYKLVVCTVATHYQTGDSAVVSTTTDLTIPAGAHWTLYLPNKATSYIAFILGSGTGSCSIYHLQPGPTGEPPQHAAAAHAVTDVGYAVTGAGRDVAVTVTAGTTCLCTSWVVGGDPVEGCALSGSTLTITTGAPDTNVGYVCTT